jgi:hypothetical protein
MLNIVPKMMHYMLHDTSEGLIGAKFLPSRNNLLYRSLEMESMPPPLATRSDSLTQENPAEYLVAVRLLIPRVAWCGLSELTISLPTPPPFSDTADNG